jgi:hypothetical protein
VRSTVWAKTVKKNEIKTRFAEQKRGFPGREAAPRLTTKPQYGNMPPCSNDSRFYLSPLPGGGGASNSVFTVAKLST